jgi:outer membrane receptor protein involved in Fe transport
MRTFEASMAYTKGNFSHGLNFYYNTGFDAIGSNAKKQPENIGKRQMVGLELYSKYLMNTGAGVLSKMRVDAFVSYLKSTEDLKNTGDFTETGNMSPIKVRLIATAYFGNNLSVSLQNRFNAATKTVATNPLKEIDSWFVTDLNVTYRNLFIKGMSAGLKVYNVLDTKYYHAGYRDAGAGEVAVDAAGNHVESKSWYNSRLPQPARNAHIFLRFDF